MTVPDLDMLPAMDVAGRAGRVRDALSGVACEALLVTKLVNVRWLTGFTGSAGMLLVLPDGLLLVTDGRYDQQAHEQLQRAGVDARVVIGRTMPAQHVALAEAARPLMRIALEAEHVTWAAQRRFAGEVFAGADVVPTHNLVDRLRRDKEPAEVARIEAASAIATAALERIGPRLADGPTERDFGLELDVEMRRLGASGPSFETIVASGPNGAKPHHRPSSRRIVEGDLVVLDYGSLVDGYCSDMTRTVMVGSPSPTQARMLEVVTAAQAAGVAAVRDGVPCVDVDRACRAVIEDAGWGDAFVHGTGHGVGLEIHEDPRLSFASEPTATLAAGFVVTVEPGVYLADHGGVRVEDTVVVTADGCRPLTHAPKDPQWPLRQPTT